MIIKNKSLIEFELMALCPLPKYKLYMMSAWVGCVSFAINSKEIIDRYLQETKDPYRVSSSPLEKIIDKSTGTDIEFVKRFIIWVNENLWGEI